MQIEKIYLHCSDSAYGNVLLIDSWHKSKGWEGIGYHLVVLNGFSFSTGYPTGKKDYWEFLNGMSCPGRPLNANVWLEADEVGAHAYGYNRSSVGICLIGLPGEFSVKQLTTSRVAIIAYMKAFGLTAENVKGHYEVNPGKTCPGLDMDIYREFIQDPNKLQELMQVNILPKKEE